MPNKVSFSSQRFETAIVPRKANGESHSVYGGMDADVTWFHGHAIKQTFATGEAANLATGVPASPATPTTVNSRAPLIFFTATTYGLNLSAGEQSMAPNLLLGYRRTEATVIPIPDSSQEVRSVFADIHITTTSNATLVSTNFSTIGGVRIRQSFATGKAAESVAASDPEVQEKLNKAAGGAVGTLEHLKEHSQFLAGEVDKQVDRLKETQLDAAADALHTSGLIDDANLAILKSQSAFNKSVALRGCAKGLLSENDVSKLEKYLVILRDIK